MEINLKLVMTLLVRDEIDIIRENIEFHLAHGVDHIIATDNGSVDGTRDVLAEYESCGAATVIDEPGRDFSQWKWVTRMALVAKDELGADWVMNNDADEFWCPPGENLKDALISENIDILMCTRRNMIFAHDDISEAPWPQKILHRVVNPQSIHLLVNPMEDSLPCPYFYLALLGKALLGCKGLEGVSQGNHGAQYHHAAETRESDIVIYHFPVRSKSQFGSKIFQGGAAYARNTELSANTGWHWRRWYRMLEERGLEAVISEVLPDQKRLRQDLSEGVVVRDEAMSLKLKAL